MSVTLDEMRDSLISVDEVRQRLATTEPVSSHEFVTGEASFTVNADVANQPSTVRFGNKEFAIAPTAMLEATSLCGLPKGYVSRTPVTLIEPQVNYWFQNGFKENKAWKALVVGDTVEALTRGTVQPFSNLALLDQVVAGIQNRFGSDVEILADYKFHHTLAGTHLRLIVPSQGRVIQDTGVDDDQWSIGIQMKNSQTALEATSVEGYLFRWWCTNGAISTRNESGVWSRRSGGQGDEVYEWMRSAVDEILGGFESALDDVQHMVHVPIEGEVNAALRDVFDTYKVPVAERAAIIEHMVESDDLTMYGLMQAITQVANSESVSPGHVDQLMRIGGDLPRATAERCGACHRLM